jgi:ABC-type Fe3+-hydroxamate transport system substrate-binding protein
MKKAFGIVSLSTILLLLFSTLSVSAQAVDISGKWNMKVETSAGSGTPVFVLKQAGETITGTYTGQLGEAVVTGTLKEKLVTLQFKAGEYNVVYTGTVEGNNMKGKVAIGDAAQGTFSGTKEVK